MSNPKSHSQLCDNSNSNNNNSKTAAAPPSSLCLHWNSQIIYYSPTTHSIFQLHQTLPENSQSTIRREGGRQPASLHLLSASALQQSGLSHFLSGGWLRSSFLTSIYYFVPPLHSWSNSVGTLRTFLPRNQVGEFQIFTSSCVLPNEFPSFTLKSLAQDPLQPPFLSYHYF